MTSIGYYPGCSLRGTAAEYNRSLKAISELLGVTLQEIPEWVCCGATSAHAIDHATTLALAADTLVKARRADLDQILAPCAMCYQRLAAAVQTFRHQPDLAHRALSAMDEDPTRDLQQIRIVSLLQWLEDMPRKQLQDRVRVPLTGIKVACYYGCLLIRPPRITGETQVEAPRSMEQWVSLLGAETVRWPMALECCGGSFALSRKSVVLRQGRTIVDAARRAGADVICSACPMCQANLDMRQAEFVTGGDPSLPVVYLTQLLGRAFGLTDKALGLGRHFVPVMLPYQENVACPE